MIDQKVFQADEFKTQSEFTVNRPPDRVNQEIRNIIKTRILDIMNTGLPKTD